MRDRQMRKSKAQATALETVIAERAAMATFQPVRPSKAETIHGIAQSLLMLAASLASAVVIVSALAD